MLDMQNVSVVVGIYCRLLGMRMCAGSIVSSNSGAHGKGAKCHARRASILV